MPVDNILYLHGFNSTPEARKGRLTREACLQLPARVRPRFEAPLLPDDPTAGYETARQVLQSFSGQTLIIGSSLGGFVATLLANRYDVEAVVLINPVVRPDLFIEAHHNQSFRHPQTGDVLRMSTALRTRVAAMVPKHVIHPERFTVYVSDADEVIDHRQAMRFFRNTHLVMCPGENHTLDCYADVLPDILARGSF